MVPCLHQRNVYIKKKFQKLTVQKCILLVGAKIALTSAGLQSTSSNLRQFGAEHGNLRKSGSTFHHGTVFTPKQSTYQKEAAGMENPKMHSSTRCKNHTYLCGTEKYQSHVSQYTTEYGNLSKSGCTICHGTVFAPKQYLYQKEAIGMESPKMHSSSQCKNRTCLCWKANYPISCKPAYGRERKFVKSRSTFHHGTVFAPKQCFYLNEATGMQSPKRHSSSWCKNRICLCGTANNPVSCKPVYGRVRKFAEIWVYLSPWYRVCTKALFISKGIYRYGESKNAFLSSVQKPHLPMRDDKFSRLIQASIWPRTEVCRNPGLPFAMVPCLHQSNVYIKKKLRVWIVQKMSSSSRCKNRTYLCGTANYPFSCKPIYDRVWKFAEIRVFLSPWYRICTKGMFISKGNYRFEESKNAFR